MQDQIIVEGLWKAYSRGRVRQGTLRNSVTNLFSSFNTPKEEFFALQDINLRVAKGDVLGIVGPNGAGKSTLLKLISRITFPTKGKITIHGTLGSMLEVGTGFHPELTGRENVFLNGAIMGMRYEEISRKLDSIIEFSELPDFIDTPVKHYSSGMYVRLAFAVAAHLEPDILLIDEVLAVGDQAFRNKCLDKILDISNHGMTIIMVSHQMSYLRKLCRNGIYLHQGQLLRTGPIDEVIEAYVNQASPHTMQPLSERKDREGNGICQVSSLRFENKEGVIPSILHSGQSVLVSVRITSANPVLRNVEIRLDCHDFLGRQWFVLNNSISDGVLESCPGNTSITCAIPKLPLNEGRFYFDVSVYSERELCDKIQHAIEFEVEKGMFYPTGRLPLPVKGLLVDYKWSLEE